MITQSDRDEFASYAVSRWSEGDKVYRGGRWGSVKIQPGFYVYDRFGPGVGLLYMPGYRAILATEDESIEICRELGLNRESFR